MSILKKGRYKAIQAVKGSNGATKGYMLMNDVTREMVELSSKDIKESIIEANKYSIPSMVILNLKVTEDGKLIHVNRMDRLGMGVPPQQFFVGKVGNWALAHSNDGSPRVKVTNSSGKSFIINYKYFVDRVGYDDMRAVYDLYLDNDVAKGTRFQFSHRINTCSLDAFEDLEKALNTLLTRDLSKLKITHIDNMVEMYRLKWKKSSLERDCIYGDSCEKQVAYSELQSLERLEERYENTPEYEEFLDSMSGMTNADIINYFCDLEKLDEKYSRYPKYQELMKNLDGLTNKEILECIRQLRDDAVNKRLQENRTKQRGVPSPYPGIIYESTARTRSEWVNSLQFKLSNGIHAYNSMEYWWSLDPEERQKEINDPNSPWYNFEG